MPKMQKEKEQSKNIITDKKISHYLDLTKKALKKAKIAKQSKVEWKAEEFFDMAKRYYDDAVYFLSKDDVVNAFAAVNYAHGWLDAGARIGFFDVNDNVLFAVDKKPEKAEGKKSKR